MKLLFEDAPPTAPAGARVLVFGVWAAKIATEPLQRLAEFPPANLSPPIGVLGLIPEGAWPWLLGAGVLLALRVVTVACLLASLARPLRTPAALASAILLTFHQGLVRSIGYVNHSELPLLYAVYILAAFAVIDRSDDQGGLAPLGIAMILCFSYTATGISRVLLGAPAVFHPDTMTMWIAGYAYETTYHGWTIGRAVLDLPLPVRALSSAGLVIVTATEILALACLGSRRFRRFFLAVMIPFHLVTYVTMNILFWENLVLYILLIDWAWRWPPASNGVRASAGSQSSRWR